MVVHELGEAIKAVKLAEQSFLSTGKAHCVVSWGGKLEVVTEMTAKRRGQAVLETVRPFLCEVKSDGY